MISNLEEALFYFKEMGFTEYEAKVYISLLNAHPASAYSISRQSGVPHSRVYDITRRLIKKGFAVSAGTNPELFSPLSPDEMIEKLKRDNARMTEGLRDVLSTFSFTADFDPVWNLSDRQEAVHITLDLIREARKEIFLGIWDEELPLLRYELQQAEKRGVKIISLIYGVSKTDFGEAYYHSTVDLYGIEKYGRTIDCVADSAACITGSLGGTQPCRVVWTRNKGLVKSIEGYIIHDFYIAEINQRFGPEITEIFGRNLGKLRMKYGH